VIRIQTPVSAVERLAQKRRKGRLWKAMNPP
jgi:hypothetical protein